MRLTRKSNWERITYVSVDGPVPPLQEGMLVEVTFPNGIMWRTDLMPRDLSHKDHRLWGVDIDVLGIRVWIELIKFRDVKFL